MTKSLNTQSNVEVVISESRTTISHPLFGAEPREYRTADIVEQFYGVADNPTGILPPVVRYFSGDFSKFIVERPPFIANISFHDQCYECDYDCQEHDGEIHKYKVPIPWTVYVIDLDTSDKPDISLNSTRIYFRSSQIFTLEDELYRCSFPNVETETVCYGNVKLTFDANKTSIEGILNSVINNFWESTFNNEVYEWLEYLPGDMCFDYQTEALAYLDGKDISFILEQQLHPLERYNYVTKEISTITVGKIIEELDQKSKAISSETIAQSDNPLLTLFKQLTFNVSEITALTNEAKDKDESQTNF